LTLLYNELAAFVRTFPNKYYTALRHLQTATEDGKHISCTWRMSQDPVRSATMYLNIKHTLVNSKPAP